ncbi:MAG TPA: type II toxin-antitoxin system VapC family toxin [Ilumatobacteraceae bacterium]|nr:type II toxin-antitoxin system VapC family toxin [Ilumatobacteraceae bacterium]
MVAYVDSSALLKRYVTEADSSIAQAVLEVDKVLATSWITTVEVRRNLARLLDDADLTAARRQAEADFDQLALISCDGAVASLASDIAERYGVRSLDAVHLASAKRLLVSDLAFITFDLRQAEAARRLGLRVVGV